MSQQKRNHVSRYAAFDNTFTYNPHRNYTLEDFSSLSVTKVQSIANTLNIRNVKRYKKEELIPVLLHKHEERQNQFINVQQETVEKEVDGTMESKSENDITTDALEFTEQLKTKFREIVHCKYNNDVWFQASSIADFLEYENTRKAIVDHVDVNDKTNWHFISSLTVTFGSSKKGNLHPETIFINQYGIFDLVTKSRMPLARQFRKWLVTEVLPSIMDTGSYVCHTRLPCLTLSNEAEIENLTEYPALSVIHNAIYILECIDNNQCLYNKFGKTDYLIDRLQQHYRRHGTFKVKAVYPCCNPSVIESKLKSELNLKRIAVEATGMNGEKITELFLPEHFNTIDRIIRQIIQMDLIENDTNLVLERERTKQKEIDERIEIQHTEQLRLQLELAKLNSVQCGKKYSETQRTMDSYFSKSKEAKLT